MSLYVLGISAYYHDSAAALLRDGDLVAAAQEERFTRKKFDAAFPARSVDYCLAQAGIAMGDIDYVVFYEQPIPKFERLLSTQLAGYPRAWRVFRESMIEWLGEKLWTKTNIAKALHYPADRVLFVPHHMSHAASAMFCSPFAEAAVLTVDGVGEWTTAALGHATADWDGGKSNSIELTEEIRFPHSLGLLYSAFTGWLGFKVNSGEYKVMGMAPYGEPRYLDKVEKLVHVHDDGSFQLDLSYFKFQHSLTDTIGPRFIDLFGPPRPPESPFFTRTTGHVGVDDEVRRNEYYADVAASIQRLTEDVLLRMVRTVHARTGSKNLVMAGGVALNSVANGRIIREGPFDNVFIQPNAGDAGGALGAALYVHHVVLGERRRFVMEHAYYGEEFGGAEVEPYLLGEGVNYQRVDDPGDLAGLVVADLEQGKVVAVARGRFEWGPRALGNRSVLADPRRAEMKDVVNTKIKFRESFRPFAPAVTEEAASRFFCVPPTGHYPNRFMLAVTPVVDDRAEEIPAVVHMGTARVQTVTPESNPFYHDVIKRFGEATGIPVVLNTSFNLRGEPIVTTPADALASFGRTEMDTLVIGPCLVRK